MSLFCCPVCGQSLERSEHVYRCAAGHSFDIAKEGYTYLLRPDQKHSSTPGDDKRMATARRAFLSKGYYAPLLEALCACAQRGSAADAPLTVLDAGCGEGYYTAGLYRALTASGHLVCMAGIDISKSILRLAAKAEKGVEFAVASCYHLPFADSSADLLLDCFSPLAIGEFRRVLKPGGRFLYVVPGAMHLWELKQVLYEVPYPNEEKAILYEGFAYEGIISVDFPMELSCQEDIQALFGMTPYCWKTPRNGVQKLETLEHLSCQASFRVHCFQRLPS